MPERRDLERFTYWQGQMLRSRDFRDDAAFEAQRRWWHNRALHAPYGISYGLEVTAASVSGAPVFTVQCGLAYDCYGRELILTKSRTAPNLPAGSAAQTLLIQYAAAGAQLAWQPAANIGIPTGVPLARVTVSGGGATLDAAFLPPHARALARPRIATGDTVRGDTPWEPWIEEVAGSDGVPQPQTVGVQTHIDTSAAGFTEVPHYLAELQWPNLTDPTKAAFAPAFFPSLAEEEAEGFTFRLLMKNIARRRVAVSFGVSAVAALPIASTALAVQVEDAAGFQTGDVVARVRPRAVLAAAVGNVSGKNLTLSSPLDGVAAGDTVAIGSALRSSTVSKAPSKESVTAFQPSAQPATPVQPGDFVVQLNQAAGVPVRVLDVQDNLIILDSSLPTLNSGDQVGIARQTDLFAITTVNVGAAGAMTVTVQNGGAFSNGDVVFQLTADMTLGPISSVQSIAGNVLTLAPPIEQLSNTDQLGHVTQKVTVGGTVLKPLVLRVTVKDASVFRAGDIVARADTGSSPAARIDKVDNKKNILTLSTPIPLDIDNIVAVAYLAGSSHVLNVAAGSVTVATPSVFQNGDIVMKFGTDEEFETPSVVTGIGANGVLTITPPITGLQSGDVLVARRFPHTVTVLQATPFNTTIALLRVDSPFPFQSGDLVMRTSDAGATASLGIVFPYAPSLMVLFGAIPNLKANDQLVQVSFTAVATVASQPPDDTHLTIDRKLDIRSGDLIGPLAAYFETSSSITISKIVIANPPANDTLTLSGAIDGLIPGDLIGPASFTPTQNTIRFTTTNQNLADLHQGDLLQLSGMEPAFLQFVNAQVRITSLDSQTGIATLTPADGSANSFRPETLSVAALFNANFTDAFVAFAQQQDLYVCWLGCQNETEPPSGCPGVTTNVSPCSQKGN